MNKTKPTVNTTPPRMNEDPFALMEQLRAEGWCVVLKCLPKEFGWIVEGSRSEYDAPCPDKTVGRGLWCCELSWMRHTEAWRLGIDRLAQTPHQAVLQAWQENKRRQEKKP